MSRPKPNLSLNIPTIRVPEVRVTPRASTTYDDEGNKLLNQYRLERTLGEGASGVVKLALNEDDKTYYAIKIMKKKQRNVKFADMQLEIAIMKKIRHPNIVQLVEVIDDPSNAKLFLVLELIQGGTVGDAGVLPVPIPVAHQYFVECLSALRMLHFHNVVHRDLKPENMLLTRDNHIKLVDFGVSFMFEGSNDTLVDTRGSPAFMSPEQFCEDTFSGRKADMWSLGVCLYDFVFGQIPFKGENYLDQIRAIQHDPVVFPTAVDPDLQNLMILLLDKNPQTRLTLEHALTHRWVTHAGGTTSTIQLQTLRKIDVSDAEVQLSVKKRMTMKELADLKSQTADIARRVHERTQNMMTLTMLPPGSPRAPRSPRSPRSPRTPWELDPFASFLGREVETAEEDAPSVQSSTSSLHSNVSARHPRTSSAATPTPSVTSTSSSLSTHPPSLSL